MTVYMIFAFLSRIFTSKEWHKVKTKLKQERKNYYETKKIICNDNRCYNGSLVLQGLV